jgi:hypothetical protein
MASDIPENAKPLSLTAMIGESHGRVVGASEYAALLARHADSIDGTLSDAPPTRFLFALGTSNADMPRLAKDQFCIEMCRYALLIMLAHWERYLVELNILRRVALAVGDRKGLMKGEEFLAIMASARTAARHRSLDGQLQDLERSQDENIAAGTRWFRGLCAVRRCITHRAGIVGEEDTELIEGIAWRRMVLLRDGEPIPDAEREPKVEAGQTIGFQFEDRTKTWGLGSHVVFGGLDIQEIAFTLFSFAGMLHDSLHAEFVQLIGSTASEGPPTAG